MTKFLQRKAATSFSKAKAQYAADGFSLPHKPNEDGVPYVDSDDLTSDSDDRLMTLMAELTAWANYAATKVAHAEIEEEDAEAALRFAQAKYYIEGTERGEKVTRVRAERDSDPEVIKLSDELRAKKASRKLVTTLLANIERSTFLVSRELTRRVGLAPAQGRVGRGRA